MMLSFTRHTSSRGPPPSRRSGTPRRSSAARRSRRRRGRRADRVPRKRRRRRISDAVSFEIRSTPLCDHLTTIFVVCLARFFICGRPNWGRDLGMAYDQSACLKHLVHRSEVVFCLKLFLPRNQEGYTSTTVARAARRTGDKTGFLGPHEIQEITRPPVVSSRRPPPEQAVDPRTRPRAASFRPVRASYEPPPAE